MTWTPWHQVARTHVLKPGNRYRFSGQFSGNTYDVVLAKRLPDGRWTRDDGGTVSSWVIMRPDSNAAFCSPFCPKETT